MKAQLEFNLPEDNTEFKITTEAQKTYWFLWDFYTNEVRGKLKYGHNFKNADEALEWVRKRIDEEVDMYMEV